VRAAARSCHDDHAGAHGFRAAHGQDLDRRLRETGWGKEEREQAVTRKMGHNRQSMARHHMEARMKQGGLFDDALRGREVWELTKEEYLCLSTPPIPEVYQRVRMRKRLKLGRSHKHFVLCAIVEKKEVPQRVLDQYPDLAGQGRKGLRALLEPGGTSGAVRRATRSRVR